MRPFDLRLRLAMEQRTTFKWCHRGWWVRKKDEQGVSMFGMNDLAKRVKDKLDLYVVL